MSGLLEQLDPKELRAKLAPMDCLVSPEQWDHLVRLGLVEPKVMPASKVRLALLGRLAQRERRARRD